MIKLEDKNMAFKLFILMTALSFLGCAPLSEESYVGGSSLMGVSPSGRTAISGSITSALSGYTGTVTGGKVYVGGGYGGAGLAGQMHCNISSDVAAWLSNCNNVTTQGFLPPGRTFSSGGGQSLWSWKESTDRIMRIVGGSNQLQKNDNLSELSVNDASQTEQGEQFEDLMSTNDDYFASLQQSDFSTANIQEFDQSQSASYAGFSLTGSTSERPVYEEYSANKLSSLKCQVGSKSASYSDVVEVVLRKKSAVLNAYFAKGIGYVGYKYVRQGNGGGTGTNILVCVDTGRSAT